MPIVLRLLVGHAEGHAVRHDRHAIDGIGTRQEKTKDRVPAFVVRHTPPFFHAHEQEAPPAPDGGPRRRATLHSVTVSPGGGAVMNSRHLPTLATTEAAAAPRAFAVF